MKAVRLHHIGIVLKSLKTAQDFMERFGLEEDYREYVEAYHAWCIFTKYTERESPIEFVIPTEGVLMEYNKGKGGIHHIAFEVDDVKAIREEFKERELRMLETEPVRGAGNIIVNFLRPRHGFGVLVEFVERTDK